MKTTLRILILTFSLLSTMTAGAQQPETQPVTPLAATSQKDPMADLSIDDYTRIHLPPLHLLMENARTRSSQVNMYEARTEIEERELKSVRRTWLKYIKLNASYSYGSTDMSSMQYNTGNNQLPVIQNVTGSEQTWWNVGANFSLPLDEIFDRRNRIKKQKKKIESIQYETERWYDEVCLQIVESYSDASNSLAMLKIATEAMVTAQAQYEFSKTDFINGKINAQELSRQKNIESTAIREYAETRSQLLKALLRLEILSKTEIITLPGE